MQLHSYLANDSCLIIDAHPRWLRSADTCSLYVGRTRTSFSVRT